MKDHVPPTPRRLEPGPRRWSRPPLRVWVWAAAGLALVLVAALLWRGSDAAATDSTTSAAPEVPDAAPGGDLAEAWSVPGEPLPRRVVQSGRVMVGGERGITALDAVTGEEAWHYSRANALLCDLTAIEDLVIGVFRTEDRCDEAVALEAGTGVYAWTRNVDFDPDVDLASADQLMLASSDRSVIVYDPRGDQRRWVKRVPETCRILDADVGSTGVGVLQRCSAGTLQLRLLDGFTGDEHWLRDVAASPDADARLAGVDRLVDVVVEDRLEVHGAEDGAVLQTYGLPSSDEDPATEVLHQAGIGSLALVWARGTVWALDESTGQARWSRPAVGLPTVQEVAQVAPGAASVLVPEQDAFVRRDLATGDELERLPVEGGLSAPGRTSVVGPAVVYRLPDRVTGYR
jgi:outer membrane protein assembly factor BamB